MKTNRFGLVALAACLLAFSGCGHRGTVEELIERQYSVLKAGGSMKFVSYDERHTTKGASRTFTATGVVRWKEPWFKVAEKREAFQGFPGIVRVERLEQLAKGIGFRATFYKGRTDEKASVSLDIPSSRLYTEDTLEDELSAFCILMPDGRTLGAEFDRKAFSAKRDEAIAGADEVVRLLRENVGKLRPTVDDKLAVAFEGLNETNLNGYIDAVVDLRIETVLHLEKVLPARTAVARFADYPLPDLGQELARECLVRLQEAEKAARSMDASVKARYEKAYAERESRLRKGVKFVSGVRATSRKTEAVKTLNLNPSRVAVSDAGESTADNRQTGSADGSRSRRRAVRRPQQAAPAPPPGGPITIRMPL